MKRCLRCRRALMATAAVRLGAAKNLLARRGIQFAQAVEPDISFACPPRRLLVPWTLGKRSVHVKLWIVLPWAMAFPRLTAMPR